MSHETPCLSSTSQVITQEAVPLVHWQKSEVRNRINWIFSWIDPNVEVCQILKTTGIQLFSGLAFRIFEEIQLKSSKVI
jgi:hypothetical protein